MEITKEIFEHFCPVAVSPGDEIFEAVADAISLRKAFVADVIGTEAYSTIAERGYTPDTRPLDSVEKLAGDVARYICVAAFHDAVPQLDLVLTNTGFGIVSNSNLAPASSDRVERLKNRLAVQRDEALDDIIADARDIEGWKDSEQASRWIGSIFWNGKHARLFGDPNATRSTLDELAPKIQEAEAWLKELVSPKFYFELCAFERDMKTQQIVREAVRLARNCIVSHVNNLGSLNLHRRILLSFIEEFPELFGTYISSSAYRANHFEPYENRKEDACFFFG